MPASIPSPGTSSARAYDNSRRVASVERQRLALLDAFAEQLSQPEFAELSVATAASRAGISLRTAHRYFPSGESRLAAVAQHLDRKLGTIEHPLDDVDDIPGFIRAAYRRAEQQWELTVALYRTGVGGELRVRYLATRRKRYAQLLRAIGAPAGATKRATSAISLLASSEAGMPLVEIHGLSVREAGEVAAQAATAIIADLRARARQTSPDCLA